MRRQAKIDSNQNEIVSYARKLGFSVAITSSLGGGFPDIVLGKNGINFLGEIKDGKKPPSARKLTEPEQKFHNEWRGQICIIESIEDIDRLYKLVIDI